MTPGRNAPCPCGSGRKFKHCCGTAGRAPSRAEDSAAAAIGLMQRGQLTQAERLFRGELARNPRHADAMHFLGLCLCQTGRGEEGLALVRRSVESGKPSATYWLNLGMVLMQFGELAEAESALQHAIALSPESSAGQNYLGVVRQRQGRTQEAEAAFERAIALQPDDDGAHNNYGYALLERGEVERAAGHFRLAIEANPRNAMAHNNLGNALRAHGDADASSACYRRAVELDPGFGMARFNLGRALLDAGDTDAALEQHRWAARLAPQEPVAWQWLAEVLGRYRFSRHDTALEEEMSACLARADIEPAGLASSAASLLRADARVQPLLAAATRGDRIGLDAGVVAALCRPLVLRLLESAVVPEEDVQRLVAALRSAALRAWRTGSLPAEEGARELVCALAHQCFLTEYLAPASAEDLAALGDLQRALSSGHDAAAPPREELLALFACYLPLGQLAAAPALPGEAGTAFGRLVLRQIVEPAEEARIAAGLAAVTPISDAISRAVQAQYEIHPYPRWTGAPSTGGFPLALRLRTLFPQARHGAAIPENPAILIAGCGTGRHVAITAALSPAGSILAVDLSRASLAYAARRARELGLRNVEFAQADILELGALARRFDVIESAGVLHHMGDPLAGLRVLAGLLRPGGWMKLGLYSEIGRRNIAAARTLIAEGGFAAEVEGMRAARQAILRLPREHPAASVAQCHDFYSLSGCRDLLFHVQEQRYALAEIEAMLASLSLEFLGFEFETAAERLAYVREFPEDPAAVSLERWAQFEERHPDTFAGMYQFWVARPIP